MTPEEVIRVAWAAGLRLRAKPGGVLGYSPADRITPELRAMLIQHKAAVLVYLSEAQETTAVLIFAAMRACDHHGDGPEAREAMKQDCVKTPPYLSSDLLDYFRQTYQSKGKDHNP